MRVCVSVCVICAMTIIIFFKHRNVQQNRKTCSYRIRKCLCLEFLYLGN